MPAGTTRCSQGAEEPPAERHSDVQGAKVPSSSAGFSADADQAVERSNSFQLRSHREAGGQLGHRFPFFCSPQRM